jgi:hypothetical protein
MSKSSVALALLMAAGAGHAERPMTVDDAGTLPQGGAKIEFGWSRDDRVEGFDGAVGYGPIETLEVELNFGDARDRSVSPRARCRGAGAAVKWVPLSEETGLSAGLKYEYAFEKIKGGASANANTLLGLASLTFEAGSVVHVNLGREWVRSGGESGDSNLWGIGLDVPMTEAFHFTVETYGAQHFGPDRAIGLRYELAEGLKISGAIGKGNGRTFANAGVAWEI